MSLKKKSIKNINQFWLFTQKMSENCWQRFQLKFLKDDGDHPFLHSFKLCALTGMSVNYTNAGTYTSYEDGTPVNIRMSLTFKELNPIYHEDYQQVAAGPGVGF